MSNTLTGLIPTLYEALDVVSRELVGFIPAVTLDASVARAAVGQTVMSFVAPVATTGDVTPGTFPPDDGDQTIGNVPIVITKSKYSPIRWTGEEERGVNENGPGSRSIRVNQVAQSIRALVNLIEVDCATAAADGASRAVGTAGGTPFATGLADSANVLQILSDNGAPRTELQMVINTTTGAKLRANTQLTKANEAASDELLRQGILSNIHGFDFRESAGITSHTKGTGASYVTSGGPYAVGATAITLATGTGTILAGDVITFAGDTNNYVVEAPLGGGVVTLSNPGLKTVVAGGVAVTVGGNYLGNYGFARTAIVAATRAPALPEEGDSADDRTLITDPRSGLTLELALYKQYKRVKYELAIAWGVAAIKQEHIALLMG